MPELARFRSAGLPLRRQRRFLREVDAGGPIHNAAFDGTRLYLHVERERLRVLSTDLDDLGFAPTMQFSTHYLDLMALAPGVLVASSANGLYSLHVDSGTTSTLEFDSDVGLPLPGGRQDGFTFFSYEGDSLYRVWLFDLDEAHQLHLLATHEYRRTGEEGGTYRWGNGPWMRQVGDWLVTLEGELLDVGSPACLEEGDCFGVVHDLGSPLMQVGAAGSDALLVLRWDDYFYGRSIFPDSYRRELERHDLVTGHVDRAPFAVPAHTEYVSPIAWGFETLLNDPWTNSVWIAAGGMDRSELYRVRFD